MIREISLQERYYHKFEYLAKQYANKIWNEENLGLEKEDIEQELRLRLFTCIKSYGVAWGKWRNYQESIKNNPDNPTPMVYKPSPIHFYVKNMMINKSRDFIKEINKSSFVNMSEINFDFGNDDTSVININEGDFNIDGYNILEVIKSKRQRKIVAFHLKGIDTKKIKDIYKKSYDPSSIDKIIKTNLEKIRTFLSSQITQTKEYAFQTYNEDNN